MFRAMNAGSNVKYFRNYTKFFSTAADIFAGTIKSKDIAYRAKFPPASYGGRYIVSMLPGNLISNKLHHL